MVFIDQVGRSLEINIPVRRIISIVPSQTELLFDLGLNDEVIGITKFCIHPDTWFRTKKRVGGTKKLHLDVIRELQPDLILANKEENTREELEILMQEFPVWISDIKDIHDAFHMIVEVGKLCNKEKEAISLTDAIYNSFNWHQHTKGSAVYFIWNDPIMIAGGDTFISSMMKLAGFSNAAMVMMRYPVVTIKKIQKLNPEYILLSSEPFPFKEKHQQEYSKLFPGSTVLLVDGELFSWYGSRMREAPAYFQTLTSYRS